MSMGGMVNSILASTFRAKLPTHVKFGFLVTTPNLKSNPAIPDSLLEEWKTAKPGNILDFESILKPFFSSKFLNTQNPIAQSYYHYRAMGLNQQTPKAFFRQMKALRSFDGEKTFSAINTDECKFIGGDDDRILGPSHNVDLKNLSPSANHSEINNLGHMVNYERPDLFDFRQAIYV
jgi:pimeloyl-ACP methyl ester carboxylesterase